MRPMVSKNPAFSSRRGRVLTDSAGEQDVVLTAAAHRTARQAPAPKLAGALRTAPPQPRQGRPPPERCAIEGHDRPAAIHEHDVVPIAAILVVAVEGPPAGSEGKAAVPTGEVSEIGHGPSLGPGKPRRRPRLA